jgi:hypothetical protein
VLEQDSHLRRAFGVDLQRAGGHERAHGEHAGGTRPVGGAERQRQREPGALREATHDGLVAGHALLFARGVEQVVERGERFGEAGARIVADVVPGEPGRRRQRASREHGREMTLRVEVAQQPTQVALVGAVAVEEQQQAVGLAPPHDVGDQIHRTPRFSQRAGVQNM